VLLVFGTGSGLAPQALEGAEMLSPLRCLDDYNHLSVRSAVAITVDRILGDVY
jgi:tRNA (guanine37-N1)-methyltransferase